MYLYSLALLAIGLTKELEKEPQFHTSAPAVSPDLTQPPTILRKCVYKERKEFRITIWLIF